MVEPKYLTRFKFNWSIVGDDGSPPVDPDNPNILTFTCVSEKELLVYFKCEVTEAGKTVLVIHRAFYRSKYSMFKIKHKFSFFIFLFRFARRTRSVFEFILRPTRYRVAYTTFNNNRI